MNADFENPFSGFGQKITGSRFIGRTQGLEVIYNRIVRPAVIGNLAIVGMHGMGKSSLIARAIFLYRDELLTKRRVLVQSSLSTYQDVREFFFQLTFLSFQELERLDWLTPAITEALPEEGKVSQRWGIYYHKIKKFFQVVRDAGISLLFVFADFDYARRLLSSNEARGFTGLRELTNESVRFITLSRRTIKEIEIQSAGFSTLDQMLPNPYFLKPFGKDELDVYYSRLEQIGIVVTDSLKEFLRFYCGGHPYLLELLGYEIVEYYRQQRNLSLEEIRPLFTLALQDYFDNVIRRLQEDGGLSKLLQIVFGPVLDATRNDTRTFVHYGLLQEHADETNPSEFVYTCFSDAFQEYLSTLGLNLHLFPVLEETEQLLRRLIESELSKMHQSHWHEALQEQFPRMFRQYTSFLAKDQENWQAVSSNILEYLYLNDLVTILLANEYWGKLFKPIFVTQKGKDKTYWQNALEHIVKTRNPVAHFRQHIIPSSSKALCESYCIEINRTIREYWEKTV